MDACAHCKQPMTDFYSGVSVIDGDYVQRYCTDKCARLGEMSRLTRQRDRAVALLREVVEAEEEWSAEEVTAFDSRVWKFLREIEEVE